MPSWPWSPWVHSCSETVLINHVLIMWWDKVMTLDVQYRMSFMLKLYCLKSHKQYNFTIKPPPDTGWHHPNDKYSDRSKAKWFQRPWTDCVNNINDIRDGFTYKWKRGTKTTNIVSWQKAILKTSMYSDHFKIPWQQDTSLLKDATYQTICTHPDLPLIPFSPTLCLCSYFYQH